MSRTLFAIALMAAAAGAAAEVIESGPSGFLVRHEVAVSAPPDKAYAAFLDIGSWWNGSHSYSGNAANLTLDARPGGCFCEKLANGGGVEHMRVVLVMPNQTLRMSGGLGPLQAHALAGSMTWAFAAAPGGTKVQLSYSVGGFMQGGIDKMAGPVNGMLAEQIGRYKLLVDTGKPTADPVAPAK
jgi:uncharacterized protein YndB with AHSA1/START domain